MVSPGSETADRIHKPAEYAANGIPFYWRVEINRAPAADRSTVTVHTFHIDDGVYRRGGVFEPDDVVQQPDLGWARVSVKDLIPRQ